jgi:hypothetical protein
MMYINGVKRRGNTHAAAGDSAANVSVGVPPSTTTGKKSKGGGDGNGKILVLAITGFLLCLVVSMFSVEVIYLGKRQKVGEKGVVSGKTVVKTPAFDSSKLGQKREERLQKLQAKQRQHAAIPTPPRLSEFPRWIQEYVTWHSQQRKLYPGMQLFDSPDAPKLLVRTCLGLCGGLHDRIGQLPWDLYLAAKTKRLLLLAWQRPKELENFLLPNEIRVDDNENIEKLMLDWRVPLEAHFGFNDMKRVRNYTQLFEGYADDRPEDDFWDSQLDLSIERAVSGEFANIRVLRHRILGHLNEGLLEQRLQNEGWYANDSPHQPQQIHGAPTFGNIFHLFFRPSPAVYNEIEGVLKELKLRPSEYMAVHCRVRHPKAHQAGSVVKGKNANYPADKTGLPWSDGHPLREFACQTATTALECARVIGKGDGDISLSGTSNSFPIYFLADSNDLVRHVSIELQDTLGYLQSNKTGIYVPLLNEIQSIPHRRIVARDVTLENAHIDRQKGREPPAYFGTFIDLYLAMQAKCVVYGIGYYAAFAAKISGTTCSYLYAQESWGSQVSKQAHICPNSVRNDNQKE